jgi:phthalate 4,5-cis-dihydrodiol dehydrogenase
MYLVLRQVTDMATASANSGKRILGLGLVGLGGAALGMLPKMSTNPGFRIAAVADVDEGILRSFKQDHPDVNTYTNMQALCQDDGVDLVYIATPNRLHSEHAIAAFDAGKHVLIEKPMTIEIPSALEMVEAAEKRGVLLGVNVKHSFEPRVRKVREMVRTEEFGKLRMINAWRYVDWLYRPRTPEELTPEWGGGILWRQAPHQLDIIRTIGGGVVRSVRGMAGVWDPARRVAGTHASFLDFEDGAVATAVINGYDHYDSRLLVFGPTAVDPSRHAAARKELRESLVGASEAEAAAAERYGGERTGEANRPQSGLGGGWIMGGPTVISFDHADVSFSLNGLEVFSDDARYEIDLRGPEDGRDGRLNSFYESIVNGAPLPADGRWGLGTLEVLLAIEKSSETRADVLLEHQGPSVD